MRKIRRIQTTDFKLYDPTGEKDSQDITNTQLESLHPDARASDLVSKTNLTIDGKKKKRALSEMMSNKEAVT